MHPDPLEALLAPQPAPSPRPDVFAHTLAALRRQRRWRRLAGVAALTASYAAGLLTVLALTPGACVHSPIVVSRPPVPPPVVSMPLPALDLEWEAVENPRSAAGLYRQAADQHLADADPAEALRCYGNSLNAGKAANLEASSEDSWLLLAIKHARKKERLACAKSSP